MKKRIWSDEENANIKKWFGKFTTAEIAGFLFCDSGVANRQIIALGLRQKRSSPKMDAAQKARKNAVISARVYEPKYTDKERELMEAGNRLAQVSWMGVCRVS